MNFFKNIRIVLVSPQISENIGLTARIMKNMDFSQLSLVAPPQLDKAYQVAKRAKDILEKAKVYSTLSEAVANFNFILATSRRQRKDRLVYALKDVLSVIVSLAKRGLKIGVLFGREDFGLSKEELNYADILLRIPSSFNFPSLNLSFAVGLFCYELFCFSKSIYQIPILDYASKKDISSLYKYIGEVLEKIDYQDKAIPPSKRALSSLKRIFRRTYLSKREVELLKSIFLRLRERLK